MSCAAEDSTKHMNAKTYEIKRIMKRGTEWVTWVGGVALAQRDRVHKPDHLLPPKRRTRKIRSRAKHPTTPSEARVLRRFPWAQNSLGTLEYVEDLHDEIDEVDSQPVEQVKSMHQVENETC